MKYFFIHCRIYVLHRLDFHQWWLPFLGNLSPFLYFLCPLVGGMSTDNVARGATTAKAGPIIKYHKSNYLDVFKFTTALFRCCQSHINLNKPLKLIHLLASPHFWNPGWNSWSHRMQQYILSSSRKLLGATDIVFHFCPATYLTRDEGYLTVPF